MLGLLGDARREQRDRSGDDRHQQRRNDENRQSLGQTRVAIEQIRQSAQKNRQQHRAENEQQHIKRKINQNQQQNRRQHDADGDQKTADERLIELVFRIHGVKLRITNWKQVLLIPNS